MKRWLIILFIITLSFTFYEIAVSYSLFETENDIVINSDIGRWQILVNDESINETTTFEVSNVQVSGEPNVREDYFESYQYDKQFHSKYLLLFHLDQLQYQNNH